MIHHFTVFHLPYIDLLREMGYTVHVAARDVLGGESRRLLDERADLVIDIPFDRSPVSKSNLPAYRQLEKLINENDYDIVHCNTPVVGVMTRLAARKARKKGTKVIYTAHGFHFFTGAPAQNWLVYYPLEKFLGRHFTDCLITVCSEDYDRAVARRLCGRVERIPSIGVDSSRFSPANEDDRARLRESLGYDGGDIVCLCVGELNKNKNQALLISAMPAVLEKAPGFRLILVGYGPSEGELHALAEEKGVGGAVSFLGQRTDVPELTGACDIIASASFREGFGMAVAEGMAAGKPVCLSRNRGHCESNIDGRTALFFDPNSREEAEAALIKLSVDPELRARLGAEAAERAKLFTSDKVAEELRRIYTEVAEG